MTKNKTELKPCPFCNRPPYRTADEDAFAYTAYGRPWFRVGCDYCGIEFKDLKIWDENSCLTKECYPKDSFDRWNIRASLPKPLSRSEFYELSKEFEIKQGLGDFSTLFDDFYDHLIKKGIICDE